MFKRIGRRKLSLPELNLLNGYAAAQSSEWNTEGRRQLSAGKWDGADRQRRPF